MNNYGAFEEDSPWLPPTSFDLDFYLEAMNEYIDALDAPTGELLQKFDAIDTRVIARADKSKTQFSLAYSSLLFQRPLSPILLVALSTEAMRQAADAGIACERYRREHKKLPTSLEALVPKFLPSIPIDPFSGKPMLLKIADDGITIYSVGRNGEDNDGSIMDFENGDIGLRFLTK